MYDIVVNTHAYIHSTHAHIHIHTHTPCAIQPVPFFTGVVV